MIGADDHPEILSYVSQILSNRQLNVCYVKDPLSRKNFAFDACLSFRLYTEDRLSDACFAVYILPIWIKRSSIFDLLSRLILTLYASIRYCVNHKIRQKLTKYFNHCFTVCYNAIFILCYHTILCVPCIKLLSMVLQYMASSPQSSNSNSLHSYPGAFLQQTVSIADKALQVTPPLLHTCRLARV